MPGHPAGKLARCSAAHSVGNQKEQTVGVCRKLLRRAVEIDRVAMLKIRNKICVLVVVARVSDVGQRIDANANPRVGANGWFG